MRDITFRARRTDNEEWVEGNLVWIKNCNDEPYQCFIISHLAYMEYGEFDDTYQVIPETVGQYTGLKDKDGKKIFEGDIVGCYGLMRTVEYDSEFAHFEFGKHDNVENPDGLALCCDHDASEVIGNIHDNPELFEVK